MMGGIGCKIYIFGDCSQGTIFFFFDFYFFDKRNVSAKRNGQKK